MKSGRVWSAVVEKPASTLSGHFHNLGNPRPETRDVADDRSLSSRPEDHRSAPGRRRRKPWQALATGVSGHVPIVAPVVRHSLTRPCQRLATDTCGFAFSSASKVSTNVFLLARCSLQSIKRPHGHTEALLGGMLFRPGRVNQDSYTIAAVPKTFWFPTKMCEWSHPLSWSGSWVRSRIAYPY